MELIKFNDYCVKYSFPLVITIGAFDGIHLGHQELIKNAVSKSKKLNYKSAVITFNPHPNEIISKEKRFSINSLETKAKIIESSISVSEMPVRIHLYQALPKGEKLDFIIQKAVECGAYDIIPFESERCVVKVKSDAEVRKTERRNKISLEAAKQCGRTIIPIVYETISFTQMLHNAKKSDLTLFCYEGEGVEQMGKVLKEYRTVNSHISDISIIIGSEGGFSNREVQTAIENGFLATGLGKRILRAETAAILALSSLVYEFELS